MTNIIEQIIAANPDQLYLEFTESDCEKALPQSKNYSHDAARYRAYLNRLCLNLLTPVFKGIYKKVEPALLSDNFPYIWEFINGSLLKVDNLKLAIIPSENIDIEEFSIPAEWVEIPQLAADYYLAVQVNIEEHWLRIWGFIDYRKLQLKGKFEQSDRSYYLDQEDLYTDLDIIIKLSQEFKTISSPTVETLAPLGFLQKRELINKLSQPTNYSPRIRVNFEDWKKVFADEISRYSIYKNRIGKVPAKISSWLQEDAQNFWLSLQTLVNFGLITTIKGGKKSSVRSKVVLTKGKPIDLGLEIENFFISLVCVGEQETENSYNIVLQLRPSGEQNYLPPNVELVVYDEKGEIFDQAKSRQADNLIQLQLQGYVGEEFSVKVALGEVFVIEEFQV